MPSPELDAILTSCDRQSGILLNLAGLVNDSNAAAKPSEDGWTIAEHLCHVHECRYGWLGKVSPEHQALLGDVLRQEGDNWIPIQDLDEIRRQLGISAQAVRDAVSTKIEAGNLQVGPYSHPIFFLQHMLWHEGYHFALILLALRNVGQAPPEDWEEANVWGIWRS